MNTRTRMQLLAALAATGVVFATGCEQRNTDKTATTTTTTTTSKTASSAPSSTGSVSSTAPSSSSTAADTTSSTMPAPSAAVAVDDASITTQVKAAVMADPNLKVAEINVDTKDGVVTLAGTVASQDQKQRANQVAQQVQGVKSVSDQLVVKAS